MGRKKYSRELKSRIALDAIKRQKTIAELASAHMVFVPIRSVCGKSSYSMLFLLFLAVEKIKTPRRKRWSVIICIKRLASYRGIAEYFGFFNFWIPHQSLAGKIRSEINWGRDVVKKVALLMY